MSESSVSPSCAVILAAGKSTRMRSRIPKSLHPLCGLPLTQHVVNSCRTAGIERVVVVVGHEADLVRAGLGDDVEYAVQSQQRGTGDAAAAAIPLLQGFKGSVLVLAGDVPLLKSETLTGLLEWHRSTGATATLLTAFLDDPTGYGRIIRGANGSVARIVEHKDASEDERAVKEWNPSIYCFESDDLISALGEITPANAQGEYYLTDTIGILTSRGRRVEAFPASDSREVLGVNTRVELAEVHAILRRRILNDLMLSGVTIADPSSTYIDYGVSIGRDTVIEPQTFLMSGTVIGEECTIGPFTRIKQSSIGSSTIVLASQVVDSVVGNNVRIGPFANLRAGCRISDGVKIGDFVEVKNSTLDRKVSAGHLAYLGDSDIGEGTNIGAGTITCNYDGFRKHRTTIGKNAFIGSHSTLIAPVAVGDGAFVAAGSPVGEDIPADALVVARSRPTIKPQWAAKWREKNR